MWNAISQWKVRDDPLHVTFILQKHQEATVALQYCNAWEITRLSVFILNQFLPLPQKKKKIAALKQGHMPNALYFLSLAMTC